MIRTSRPLSRHCAAGAITTALLAISITAAHAQAARSVQGAPQRAAPAQAAGGVAPAGLPGVQASPGGLTTPTAAGLPSPNPTNLASPGTSPGTAPGTPVANPAAAAAAPSADTSAVIQPGAQPTGVTAGAGAPGPAQNVPAGPNGYTAVELARAFRAADTNLNGELTRAEAQRLSIMPSSFEEMDRNKDGILSRSEYEDGVR